MVRLIFPYLVASLFCVGAILTAIWAFIVHRAKAIECDALTSRLPEACRLADLTERVADAENRLGNMKEELSTANMIIEKKEEAERWLRENNQQLLQVEAERREQEKLRAELDDLLRRIQDEKKGSDELFRTVNQAKLDLDRMNEEKNSLSGQIDSLKRTLRETQSAIETLESKRSALKAEVSGLEVQAVQTRIDAEDAQKAFTAWKKEKDQETGRVKAEYDKWLKARDDVKADHDRLKGELGGLQTLVEKLRAQTGRTEDQYGDLWQPVLRKESFAGKRTDGEKQCLETVEKYLADLGLKFHRRVVYAFHTSLKTADISSLVVLAGISGTGKSELPRRYAEGMGMHFMNIAVQPRWDSPQDMFGFFNYLEARYRATELARALVQMDPHYREQGRWEMPQNWSGHIDDQMLLVLLDEMNLARVEYYFSEFLSRLEIRRGIKADDANSRRKAEIPLEIGVKGNRASTLNLFVDRNVLFAGTMNEDETTQTLSDKVVDRANVLRFGRPGNLARVSKEGRPQPARQFVSYKAWQGWLRSGDDLDDDVGKQVDQWVQQLNDLMVLIRRPFAFRVHQAIRSYVANYPDQSEDGAKTAVADQIEQKILPKFRGLDPADQGAVQALTRLTALLGELGDSQLVHAVEENRRSGEHLFVWQGVDRMAQEGI